MCVCVCLVSQKAEENKTENLRIENIYIYIYYVFKDFVRIDKSLLCCLVTGMYSHVIF